MEGRDALLEPRDGVVLEQVEFSNAHGDWHPAYCGWRTPRYQYVEYDAGQGREFYDYEKDPHELNNAIRDDEYAGRIARHRQRAEAACFPSPPGFDW